MSQKEELKFVAYLGIDWTDEKHDILLNGLASVSGCNLLLRMGSPNLNNQESSVEGRSTSALDPLQIQTSGDHVTLNLTGAFPDQINQGIIVDPSYRIFTHDSCATENADRWPPQRKTQPWLVSVPLESIDQD